MTRTDPDKTRKPHSQLPDLLLVEADELRVLRWITERPRDLLTFPDGMPEGLAGIARRRLRLLGLIRLVVPADEGQEAYYAVTPAGWTVLDDAMRTDTRITPRRPPTSTA